MTVYVDEARLPLGRMLMCHMIADTHEELLRMARRIGVATRWLQHEGTAKEHLDVCQAKRAAAVRAGAIEVTRRELVALMHGQRLGRPRANN